MINTNNEHRTHIVGPYGPYQSWHYVCTCGKVGPARSIFDTAATEATDHKLATL